MVESAIQRYALFAAICLGYAFAILWLVFRRRLSLQSSLLYLVLMVGLAGSIGIVNYVPQIVPALGFALPSNLLFTVAIGVLGFLHLMALLNASRLEDRSMALVQEMALLQEQMSRLQAAVFATTPVDKQNVTSAESPPLG